MPSHPAAGARPRTSSIAPPPPGALKAKKKTTREAKAPEKKPPSKELRKNGGPRGKGASDADIEQSGKAQIIRPKAGAQYRCNARADTLDFRDRMYEPTLIEVPSTIPLAQYLAYKVPVLDQGQEGACTGFGLATVANCLLMRRKQKPDKTQVSARMFYELARRYDEWPGEDYEGSSARGAMKGWHKHGVCSWDDWPYKVPPGDHGFTDARMCAARTRPLGSYFRVNHKDLISMHAAIAEVGVLYATCAVHTGWQEVGADGIIHQSDSMIGGHAFAIVAYDRDGLWIQNSWGDDWGKEGMCHLSYDDWLANGTDVWVARLGAPVNIGKPLSFATAHASTSGHSVAYAYANLRPHIISVGNDGRLQPGGDYGTSEREVKAIFEADLEPQVKAKKISRLVLYAHGGLVGEDAAVQRVAEYRASLLDAGAYPLAFIWHSDYWTTITNILQDAVRRRRPEGVLDKAKDFMLDRLDDGLEPVARLLSGKAAWDEMKENALRASAAGGAADVVVKYLAKLMSDHPQLEVHLVGHSAGSIFLAPLAQLLATEGEIEKGPIAGRTGANLPVASLTLWAPACTVDLFNACYRPLIDAGAIARSAMFYLTDKAEQDDNCARIYNKSLLYLVSHAFEARPRIPVVFDEGIPILGMERTLKSDQDLAKWIGGGKMDLVPSPNDVAVGTQAAARATHHGDFDDDIATVSATFLRILASAGKPHAKPALAAAKPRNGLPAAVRNLVFEKSASRLRSRRLEIDAQTKVGA
ncbi:C1 family peptidase [Massilia sp. ST3]|uniref:C1 family peptidase n=1 Tax=Massilia sp. ST3 TaxID=2824903 RepID=UPI001B84122B|nr:C1 family peptidase [Massilia sp. ST3]MBQ5949918.1 C1 family peptidase [Massilia sp. ST3]